MINLIKSCTKFGHFGFILSKYEKTTYNLQIVWMIGVVTVTQDRRQSPFDRTQTTSYSPSHSNYVLIFLAPFPRHIE